MSRSRRRTGHWWLVLAIAVAVAVGAGSIAIVEFISSLGTPYPWPLRGVWAAMIWAIFGAAPTVAAARKWREARRRAQESA